MQHNLNLQSDPVRPRKTLKTQLENWLVSLFKTTSYKKSYLVFFIIFLFVFFVGSEELGK